MLSLFFVAVFLVQNVAGITCPDACICLTNSILCTGREGYDAVDDNGILKIGSQLHVHDFPNVDELTIQGFDLSNLDVEHNLLGFDATHDNITKLVLRNNNLVELNGNMFQGMTRLQELDLSFNSIRDIKPGVFRNLKQLRNLNFTAGLDTSSETSPEDRAEILAQLFKHDDDVAQSSWNDMHNLVEIDLQYNELTRIKPTTFCTLKGAPEVDFSYNKLEEFELVDTCATGDQDGRLRGLNLSHNNLVRLASSTVSAITKWYDVQFVDFSENPWSCNCDNIDFLVWIRDHYDLMRLTEQTVCSSKNANTIIGRQLEDLKTADLESLDCPHMVLPLNPSDRTVIREAITSEDNDGRTYLKDPPSSHFSNVVFVLAMLSLAATIAIMAYKRRQLIRRAFVENHKWFGVGGYSKLNEEARVEPEFV